MQKNSTAEQLKKYDAYRAELKNRIAERRALVIDEALPGSMDYSKDRVQAPSKDTMFAIHLRIERRCTELDKRIEWLNDQLHGIEEDINKVADAPCKRMLHMRYIETRSWSDICKELTKTYPAYSYSDEYIRGKLHQRALALYAKEKQKITQ